jgi:hypothetical protein
MNNGIRKIMIAMLHSCIQEYFEYCIVVLLACLITGRVTVRVTGRVLCQIGPDKRERVVQYASRMLRPPELKYSTYEKEALAIVWGCQQFRSYLEGRPFLIRTDHASLQWMRRAEKGRVARWSMAMANFQYTLHHRKGTANANADVLSRTARALDAEELEDMLTRADPSPTVQVHAITMDAVQHENHPDSPLKQALQESQERDPRKRALRQLLEAGNTAAALELAQQTVCHDKNTMQVCLQEGFVCRQTGRQRPMRRAAAPTDSTDATEEQLQQQENVMQILVPDD